MYLERVRRSLSRIQNHAASDQAYDDLMHFFEDCWHLKNYIKSCIAPEYGRKLEQAVDMGQYPSLCIVADLANKTKHVVLTKRNRVDATVTHKRIRVYDRSYSLPATAEYTVTLRDGSTHDAHAVALRAMTEWEGILKSYSV